MIRKLAVLVTSALFLGGCFDMEQSLNVDDQGNAVVRAQIAMDAALLAMAAQSSETSPSSFCEEKAAESVAGVETTIETRAEKGDQICVITARGPLPALVEAIRDKALKDNLPEQAQGLDFELSETSPGIYRFLIAFDRPDEFDPEDMPNEMAEAAKSMMLAAVAGRSISWSVSAPEIIETTGTTSEDGRTTSFSIPLADLLTSPKDRYEFVVTFRGEKPGILDRVKGLFD